MNRQLPCSPFCARQYPVTTLTLLAPILTTPPKSRTRETQTASPLSPNAMDTVTGVRRGHCHCPPIGRRQKRRARRKKKNPFFQFDVSFLTNLSSRNSSVKLSTNEEDAPPLPPPPSSSNNKRGRYNLLDLMDNNNVLNMWLLFLLLSLLTTKCV